MNNIPLVSVVCTTYNHEKYIRNTLEGFVMQKVLFSVEFIIHDDASIDSTSSIIKEYERKYPDLFICIYRKENLFSKGINIWEYLFKNIVKGKYIALCEGDDYWTDPLKLQKQVTFLENNPLYGMVFTPVLMQFGNGNVVLQKMGSAKTDLKEILCDNPVVTLTTCMRTELAQRYNELNLQKSSWKMWDYPLWIFFARESKIGILNEITGVYRILEESLSHSQNVSKEISFIKSRMEISDFFIQKYKYFHLKGQMIYSGTKEITAKCLKYNQIALLREELKRIPNIHIGIFFLKKIVFTKIGRYVLKKYWKLA